MEANTVILSLSEYNALRDFRTNLEKDYTYSVSNYSNILTPYNGVAYQGVTYISKDEAVKKIALINEELSKKLGDLEAENLELRRGIDKKNQPKEMSVEEHLERHKELHKELHKALDELLADYISHHPNDVEFTKIPLIKLMNWSFGETVNPTELTEG